MGLGHRVACATKQKLGIDDGYDALEITPELGERLYSELPERKSISVQPNKDGGGPKDAIDLLTAVHNPSAGPHSFELQYVNGLVGFQWVMATETAQKQMQRQLETFYPDAHIDVSEHDQPTLLPLEEGRYVAGAYLRLRKREDGRHLYPIKHMDIEGFENDPYGSITAEMIGEREIDCQTDLAVQTIFEPASNNWWKGGLLAPSIDDIADELKSPRKDEGFKHAIKKELFPEKFEIVGEERDPSNKDKQAANTVREQRGEKGFRLNLRIVGVSDDPQMAIQRVAETAQQFDAYYESKTEQGFEVVPLYDKNLIRELERAYGRTRADRTLVMGVRGAAGLIHIPNDDINTQDVDWSLTSHAGDVPANAPRFSEYHDAEVVPWEKESRSFDLEGSDQWQYDIPATWIPPEEYDDWEVGQTDEQDADVDSEGVGA
ncbi:hypothetical protein GWG54_16295 [Natronococcus sp. JC468]|uniref:hypothetical protein n=1 Tax=Natronococcus sp. JC468 TaxID=1961921 RepID=UPI00143C0D89|nr:hypothetical protein [Natronococcus sp. JC468]NKE37348.1 hypothetical protein [Natronococcus sp. JC468]